MAEKTEVVKKDSHTRSIVKGITWRIIATMTTVTIAYLATGDTSIALQVGAFDFFIKLMLYYGHERLWLQVPMGYFKRRNLP